MFPDDQEASAAIQRIKKNGQSLVHSVSRKASLLNKYHESLWNNSMGLNDDKSSFNVEGDNEDILAGGNIADEDNIDVDEFGEDMEADIFFWIYSELDQ